MLNPPPDYDMKKLLEEQRKSYLYDLKKQIRDAEIRKEMDRRRDIEFEMRKNEEIKTYQPFGRAGCGAPLRDEKGNIIADLHAVHMTGIIKRKLSYFVDMLPQSSNNMTDQNRESAMADKFRETGNNPKGHVDLSKTGKALLEDAIVLNEKVKKERYRQELLEQIQEQKERREKEMNLKKQQAEEDERRIREENQKMLLEYQAELRALEKKKLTKEDKKALKQNKTNNQSLNSGHKLFNSHFSSEVHKKMNHLVEKSNAMVDEHYSKNDSVVLEDKIDNMTENMTDITQNTNKWSKKQTHNDLSISKSSNPPMPSNPQKQIKIKTDFNPSPENTLAKVSFEQPNLNEIYCGETNTPNIKENVTDSYHTIEESRINDNSQNLVKDIQLTEADVSMQMNTNNVCSQREIHECKNDDISEQSSVDLPSFSTEKSEIKKLKESQKISYDQPCPTRPFDPISPTVLHPVNNTQINAYENSLDENSISSFTSQMISDKSDQNKISSKEIKIKRNLEYQENSIASSFNSSMSEELNDHNNGTNLSKESFKSQRTHTNLTIMPKIDTQRNRVTKTILVDRVESRTTIPLQSCASSPVEIHRSEFDVYIDNQSNIHFPDENLSSNQFSSTGSLNSVDELSNDNSSLAPISNESNKPIENPYIPRKCLVIKSRFNSDLSTISENSTQSTQRSKRVRTNTVTLLENRKVFHAR